MKPWHSDAALFILASPILAVRAVLRFLRHLGFLRMAIQTTLTCGTCGGIISLVGMWKCGCGHTSEGHLLRDCPVCGSVPAMIRCYRCGATEPVRR
jgi:formate dehydrogenase maturation protein FdhE